MAPGYNAFGAAPVGEVFRNQYDLRTWFRKDANGTGTVVETDNDGWTVGQNVPFSYYDRVYSRRIQARLAEVAQHEAEEVARKQKADELRGKVRLQHEVQVLQSWGARNLQDNKKQETKMPEKKTRKDLQVGDTFKYTTARDGGHTYRKTQDKRGLLQDQKWSMEHRGWLTPDRGWSDDDEVCIVPSPEQPPKMIREDVPAGQTFRYVNAPSNEHYIGVLQAQAPDLRRLGPRLVDARLIPATNYVRARFQSNGNRWNDIAEVELVTNPLVEPPVVIPTPPPHKPAFWLVWSPESKVPPTRMLTSEAQALLVAAQMVETHGGTFFAMAEVAGFRVVEEEKVVTKTEKVRVTRKI